MGVGQDGTREERTEVNGGRERESGQGGTGETGGKVKNRVGERT